MILHNLKLTNFRQHSDSTIDFARGLTGIIGANGSGKSTILEAVGYALFGAEATRGTKGSIRWNRAPVRRQAEVVLSFEVNGRRYVLVRSETNASLDEWGEFSGPTAGGATEIAAGTSAVNAYVPTLLGMSYKEFAASYMCSQKDLARLASMGGTERQQFFRNVMGIGKVDEAVAAARAAKNDLARERDGLAAGIGERAPDEEEVDAAGAFLLAGREDRRRCEEAALLASTGLQRAEAALADSLDRKTKHERLERDRDAAAREVEEARGQVDRLTAQIEEAGAAAERVVAGEAELAPLPGLRVERDALVEARAAARERMSLVERIEAVRAEVVEALDQKKDGEREMKLYDAEAHEAVRTALEEEAVEHGRLEEERTRNLHATEARRASLVQEAHRAKKKAAAIRGAGVAGACPTCKRALEDQFDAVLAMLEQEADDLELNITVEDGQLERLDVPTEEEARLAAEVVRLMADDERHRQQAADSSRGAQAAVRWGVVLDRKAGELAELRERLAAFPAEPFDPRVLHRVEETILGLEVVGRALDADRVLAGQREGLEREVAVWDRKAHDAANRQHVAMAEMEMLEFDADRHHALAVVAGEMRLARDEAQVALARAEAAVTAAEDRQRRAERALAEYDSRAQKLTDLTERLRIADTAALRLGDFRVAVAGGIRPELEELTSGFVSILTDGRFEAVTLSEDFECQLHRGGVGMEVISGGEEDVAALAMRLATSQMIAERAGHPLSLMILDEPLGSQDEQRRGNMLGLFRRLESVFPQVLLISHVPEIQHSADHAVVVEYDEAAGCARVRCESLVAT